MRIQSKCNLGLATENIDTVCTNPKIFVSNFSELLPVFSITDKYKEIMALLDAGVTMFGIGLI